MANTPQHIALVTGGSRGIGRAISKSLAQNDVYVCVNYRSRSDEAERVVEEIKSTGGQARAVQFDVADHEKTVSAIEELAKELGGFDILINNAGISVDGLVLRSKKEDWDRQINTNLYGAYLCTQAALKSMLRKKGDRRIVFLSSVVGQMGNAGQAIYSTTKSGLIGMTKSIAREVASRGITVNVIAPGYVKTEMTDGLTETQQEGLLKMIPLRRWAEPEEISNVVQFLVSPEASYITGQVIAVNGGMYL